MRLVILDRDGVINQDSDEYVKTADEWIPLPGSLEAIARLNQAGYHVVVATNQSGIGRGYYDHAALNAMHLKMYKLLAKLGGHVDGVFYCPHVPEDLCDCRKPKPGMYKDIARRWGLDLKGVPVIGDSRRDLEAAVSMGAKPILVKTGKGKDSISDLSGLGEVDIYDDLAKVVDTLVNS